MSEPSRSGAAHSASDVAELGVHLDIGRKAFPSDWVADLLRHMAGLGLNALQLHVSDDLGYRLPSARRPEIVSADHLSTTEVHELGHLAGELGIRVVPSLDMPGHFSHILRIHPELRLDDGSGGRLPAVIDLEKPDARALVGDLLEDVAELFPHSPEWNLGFDEIIPADRPELAAGLTALARARLGDSATSHDLITAQANELIATLAARGVGTRLWNDALFRGEVVALDPRATVAWWTNWHRDMAPLSVAVDRGHRVLNFHDALLYLVLGEGSYPYPTAERIAAGFHPGRFSPLPDGRPQELSTAHPQFGGVYFSIWCDAPDALTPEQVMAAAEAPLGEFAHRARTAAATSSQEGAIR